jgi:hypothetical protein
MHLRADVYAANVGDWTILLDMRRDRYFAVSAEAFAKAVSAPSSSAGQTCRRALNRDQLIGLEEDTDKHAVTSRARASNWGGNGPTAAAAALRWANAVVSAGRLDLAAREISAFKSSTKAGASNPVPLLATFNRWRPWFPRRRLCLFESLALMRFLLGAGCSADLVFGVRAMPFAAHCWVEREGGVLEDDPHYCGSFSEIVRV